MARQKKRAATEETEETREEDRTEPGALDVEVRRAEIHVDQLVRSPLNPRVIRGEGDDAKIEQLATSIRHKGVLDDLLVRSSPNGDTYEILAGDSRWRAIRLAMVEVPARAWVPCKVYPASLPDDQALEIAIESNDHRDDPHPLDQCAAFVTLRDHHGRTVEQIAARIGRSVPYVYDRLRLEQLTVAGREAFVANQISLTVALILARIGSPAAQDRTLADLVKRYPAGVPLQAARDAAKARLMVISTAPFDATDGTLPGGSCATCPKRSDTQQHLFGDLLEDTVARCTDPDCWDEKKNEAWARATATAAAEGKRIATADEQAKIAPYQWSSLAAGYERLDDVCHYLGGEKTWREHLGKKISEVEVTVISDAHGRPVDVAKRSEMMGVIGEEEPAKPADNARELEIRTAAVLRELVVAACGKRIAANKHNTLKFWRALATSILREGEWDGSLDSEIIETLERHGHEVPKDAESVASIAEAAIATLTGPQALAFALEVWLAAALLHGKDPLTSTGSPIIEALGIDTKALRREAAKKAKAALKAKSR